MTLVQYLRICLRWWWLLLISVVLSAAAAYLYSQQLPKIYSARVTLTVGSNIIENPNPDVQNLGNIGTLAEVYAELATRDPIGRAVIERLGLDISPEQLAQMISTKIIPQAQLLEIYVLDVNPQRAQLIANTLADELIRQSPTGALGRQEREKFVRSQLQDLQTKIENTDAKIKAVEDKLPALTSAVEIADAQSNLRELEQIKRDYQSNYTQFLSNLSENALNLLSVFEPAVEPVVPISPNIKNNVIIAALAGLVLALLAITVLEFADDTLIWRNERTEKMYGLPILGNIAALGRNETKLVTHDKLWSQEADMLRTLRSNIYLAAEEQSFSTVLVTSSLPGEGKSFLASNLAATTASSATDQASPTVAAGTTVILIDADLRMPTAHEIFDHPNIFGLTDVLAAPESAVEATLQKALKSTNYDNLWLLPAGKPPLDPGALLNSPKFKTVLNILKSQADLVIIDSAPILEVVDTRAAANAVDAVLLVVSDGRTRKKNIKKVVDYFKTKQNNNLLGIVVNRTKLASAYYSNYGYGYRGGNAPGSPVTANSSFFAKLFGQKQSANSAFLNLDEAAAQLGVSVDTARRWCEEGRIIATKKGRRWQIDKAALDIFVQTQQKGETEISATPAPTAENRDGDSKPSFGKLSRQV